MKLNLFQITGKFLFLIGVLCLWTTMVVAQECNIKVTNPPKDNVAVGMNFNVQGTATNIPNGSYLWVLVHRTAGFSAVWWPQGSSVIDPETRTWEVFVTFGGPQDIGYEFEIAVIVVNKAANARLQAYYDKAMETGDWRPVKMPETLCAPVLKTVMKKSHD